MGTLWRGGKGGEAGLRGRGGQQADGTNEPARAESRRPVAGHRSRSLWEQEAVAAEATWPCRHVATACYYTTTQRNSTPYFKLPTETAS